MSSRVLRLHKSDITSLPQQMCRQGWLVSDGYGRGTGYRLAGGNGTPVDNAVIGISCSQSSKPMLQTKGIMEMTHIQLTRWRYL